MDNNSNYKESFVFATLATISVNTEQIDLTNNSLIVVTAAGVITGTYVSDKMKEALEDDATYITFENIGTLAKKACDNAQKTILLTNVTLITSQGIENHFAYLYVFVDDILALSYGTFTKN